MFFLFSSRSFCYIVAAAVCHLPDHGSEWAPPPACTGSLEVRLFELPGWNETAGTAAQFPGWSRVNHAKYIVADNRVNIGTSNMAWGYFYNTAGSSLNSDDRALTSTVQAIFDRDWVSPYAHSLPRA